MIFDARPADADSQEQNKIWLDPGGLASAARQDHHWRLLADWQVRRFGSGLSRLNGVVFMGTSCLDPLPRLLMIDEYTSPEQAASAFMTTGTAFELYQGLPCSDGRPLPKTCWWLRCLSLLRRRLPY